MTEPIFFKPSSGLTAQEIATLTGAVPRADAPLDRCIVAVAALDRAGPSDLVFVQSPKFAKDLAATRAGICLTTERFSADAPAAVAVLVTPKPYEAFVAVGRALYPDAMRPSSLFEATGVSPGALVHPSARLENGVVIDPAAVIGPRAEIGAGTVIGPTAVIGAEVRIGRNCAIGAGATVSNALIGDRVIIHPGVRIGQDGFGYLSGAQGFAKVPQVGRVILQDGVEVGANSTIDRGAIRDTVIGEGTKIDNLVQIGHNVQIGRHCILISQVGVSGSCVIGDHVMLGGQVGLADNLTIGDRVMVAAQGGVISDLPANTRWAGTPAMPWRAWLRESAVRAKASRRQPSAGGDE